MIAIIIWITKELRTGSSDDIFRLSGRSFNIIVKMFEVENVELKS